MSLISSKNTTWFKAVLYVAGVYHIFWGLSVVFFPCFWFDLGSMSHPNYIHIWQLIGWYETIFGVGFLMIAANPLRHWRLLLLSFIAKISVVIGFVYFYSICEEPFVVFNMILTNHLFWLIPFAIILYNAYHHQYILDNEMIHLNKSEVVDLLGLYETDKGECVQSIINSQPALLVFLRHFGCTFCKETLSHIKKYQKEIEANGTKIILVHMHSKNVALEELKKYQFNTVDSISDPESILYKAFDLKRGTLFQLFGLKVLVRGIYLWLRKGIQFTNIEDADIFQMPGIFLMHKGKIIKQYIHHTVADVPPYVALSSCDKCSSIAS